MVGEENLLRENICQIVREKGLNYILSSSLQADDSVEYSLDQIGIFIHLYYQEDIDYYLSFLKRIPSGIHIHISASNPEIRGMIEDFIEREKISECYIVDKENRGRDISALLVAFRDKILTYKYVCFVHDKKAKGYNEKLLIETQEWIAGMWNNMFASKAYIFNVIDLFEKREGLGLLVPPEMAGIWCNHAYTDMWKTDFDNTLKLVKYLNLNCNIDIQYPPITIGTVFWCRTDAMRKLFLKKWQYSDFREEPLPLFGTLGHAVERVLAYVAQDAGFDTGYVMSVDFAQNYIFQLKDTLRVAYKNLNDVGIYSLAREELYSAQQEKIVAYMNRHQKNYFYGAGYFGKECFNIAVKIGKKPDAFLESRKVEGKENYLGLPVYAYNEIEVDEQTGILVTVSATRQEEIVCALREQGINDYLTIF